MEKKAEAVAGKIRKNVAIGTGDQIITCFQKGKSYAINNALKYGEFYKLNFKNLVTKR